MKCFQLLQTGSVEFILFIEQDVHVIYHLSSPSGNNYILWVLGFFLL